jgi:hypothetical protein
LTDVVAVGAGVAITRQWIAFELTRCLLLGLERRCNPLRLRSRLGLRRTKRIETRLRVPVDLGELVARHVTGKDPDSLDRRLHRIREPIAKAAEVLAQGIADAGLKSCVLQPMPDTGVHVRVQSKDRGISVMLSDIPDEMAADASFTASVVGR